jgi:ribosome-binding factor A
MIAVKRAVRVGDTILKEVALLLLRKVRDPRVEGVTVTGVRMSDDLRQARIYYSVLGEKSRVNRVQAGLDSAKGYIKREIGTRMALRYVPEIKFIYDPTLDLGSRMDMLFERIRSSGDLEEKDGAGEKMKEPESC